MLMSESLITSHYLAVARYNSSATTREKFSGEYLDRELEANIFGTRDEALAFLDHK